MPCAAGELCQLPDQTPVAPHGHQCHGGCGGRLHGLCGEQDQDAEYEIARICFACIASKQRGSSASTAGKGKRKGSATESGDTARPKKTKPANHPDMTGSRTRMDIGTKMEILRLLDKGTRTQKSIAEQFNCGERTVRTVKAERAKIENQAAKTRSSATTRKNFWAGDFPEESSDDEATEEPSSHMAPRPYAALSSHFGALETAAEGSGNRDAAFHLQKAKMAMIAAHGSKAARQTDMRQFL
ncbi:unnamed protein product [Ectocarpus sp. CCAP 1310/34]|nr:unnamed protein product [Ectocarpus sp. CCAP 1310/34]